MPRLTLRLGAAVLTFLVGVALASVWFISGRRAVMNGPAPATPAPKSKRTYKDVDHASVLLRDGGYAASVSTVESSDGRKFTSVIAVLPSEKSAQGEMNRILQGVTAIIKREPLSDEKGVRIGEKAVATFTADADMLEGPAALLWTRGPEFSRVRGSSLQHILEYEQDYEW